MIENLEEALKGISSHKMRSFLTMLGVIIGIASILAIVSIVEGTSRKLQKNLIGAGNNVTMVSLEANEGSDGEMSNDSNRIMQPLKKQVLKDIKDLPAVKNVSAFSSENVYNEVTYRGNYSPNGDNIIGIDKDYFKTMQVKFVEGRNFTKDEYNSPKKVCIISDSLNKNIFDGTSAINKTLDIKGEPFTIVGVIQSASEQYEEYESPNDYYNHNGMSDTSNVFISSNAWPIIAPFDPFMSVALSVNDTKQMKSAGNDAASILNSGVLPKGYEYKSSSSSESENALKTLTTAITAMLVSIASLSLLVGGIGVMNIMLVSVTERTAEIGLKKALGAKRYDILIQFLTESAVLTGLGGLIGIILGLILAKAISVAVSLEFAVSFPWILIALGFSLLIGIFFGVMPANKAAKLNPIDALRRE